MVLSVRDGAVLPTPLAERPPSNGPGYVILSYLCLSINFWGNFGVKLIKNNNLHLGFIILTAGGNVRYCNVQSLIFLINWTKNLEIYHIERNKKHVYFIFFWSKTFILNNNMIRIKPRIISLLFFNHRLTSAFWANKNPILNEKSIFINFNYLGAIMAQW